MFTLNNKLNHKPSGLMKKLCMLTVLAFGLQGATVFAQVKLEPIGADCTANADCESGACDINGTNKCVLCKDVKGNAITPGSALVNASNCGNSVLDEGECCDLGTEMNGKNLAGGDVAGDEATAHGCTSSCKTDTAGGWTCNNPDDGFGGYTTMRTEAEALLLALIDLNEAKGSPAKSWVSVNSCHLSGGGTQGLYNQDDNPIGSLTDKASVISKITSNIGNLSAASTTATDGNCTAYNALFSRWLGYTSSRVTPCGDVTNAKTLLYYSQKTSSLINFGLEAPSITGVNVDSNRPFTSIVGDPNKLGVTVTKGCGGAIDS